MSIFSRCHLPTSPMTFVTWSPPLTAFLLFFVSGRAGSVSSTSSMSLTPSLSVPMTPALSQSVYFSVCEKIKTSITLLDIILGADIPQLFVVSLCQGSGVEGGMEEDRERREGSILAHLYSPLALAINIYFYINKSSLNEKYYFNPNDLNDSFKRSAWAADFSRC